MTRSFCLLSHLELHVQLVEYRLFWRELEGEVLRMICLPCWRHFRIPLGAGLGLQQAMMAEADRNTGTLGKLLRETLAESHASSFDAALASFATKSRSAQVQRVMHLMSTAIEQDAPLQNILADMSRDYERLNDLMNRRESDLMGRSILIIMFVSVGLPFLDCIYRRPIRTKNSRFPT